MAAEVEGQFAGVEAVLQQDNTRAFADGEELGNGLLSVEERCEQRIHTVPEVVNFSSTQ